MANILNLIKFRLSFRILKTCPLLLDVLFCVLENIIKNLMTKFSLSIRNLFFLIPYNYYKLMIKLFKIELKREKKREKKTLN